MRFFRESDDRLREALAAAYERRKQPEVGDDWDEGVMRRVRMVGPVAFRPRFISLFERYIWRFAPVACVVIVILFTALVLQLDFVRDCEMASVLVEDPSNYSLFQLIDVS